MKLNRLEILGFKSFPKKTVFEFDAGIIAIVGPNGCGKTNILEAIKWVLGEQNPYKLRGEKMEDFIFNGSSSHKPLNFADVTAVIENDSTLPISYQEVAITRRFYRSGESEYFINRVNVRLKDIVSLFLNTGLKAEAYSIFSREMIDNILSPNSKVRRTLFEEAAEIAKYKNRKKTAFDNLDLTNSDLVRINDILDEVQKQWRSLKRQVRRAKRYQELKNEIKEKRILVASMDYTLLSKELLRITEELQSLEGKRKGFLNSLESIEEKLEESRSKTKEIMGMLSQLREEKNNVQSAKNKITEEIIVIDERKRNILSQTEYLVDENNSLENKIPQTIETIEETKNEKNKILGEIGKATKENTELKKKILTLEEQFVLRKKEYEKTLYERQSMEENIKTIQEQKISQTADLKNREELRDALLQELKEIKEGEQKVQEEIDKLEDEITRKKEEEKEGKKKLEKARETYNLIEERKKKKEGEIIELIEKKNILTNESDFLRNFMKEKEGYNEIVKFLNKRFTLSILPDILKVSTDKRECFLGVLENLIQTVVLTEPDKLKEILNIVEEKGMRVGIFLGFLRKSPSAIPIDKRIQGSLSQFLDVKKEGKIRDIILSLFSRYLLVETIEDALELQKIYNQYNYVTRNGDVLSDGILFTGRGSHRALLGLNDKIERNAFEMRKVKESIKEKEKEKEKIEKEKKKIEGRLEQLNTDFSRARVNLRDDELSYEKKAFEKATNEKRIEKIKEEIKDIEEGLTKLGNNIEINKKMLDKEMRTLNSLEHTRLLKETAFKEMEEQLRSLRNEENKNEILLTKLKGEVRAKEEALKSAEKELENLNSKNKRNIDRIKSYKETMHSLDEKEKGLEENRLAIKEKLTNIDISLKELNERENQVEVEIEELETKKKEITEKEKTLYEQTSKLNLEKVRNESQKNSIAENIKKEYTVTLETIKEETSPPEEKVIEELNILEERRSKFGPVNLMAEVNLKDAEQRREELITQKTDLREAQKDLLKTIEHIDRVAKEKFLATFNGVRENFQTIFKRLFETGECDLLLSEGDPLEAEITIMARPKHKKLERIKSLSTGERALIAIALLFSFYLVKPSPICVLDEIDAPLDDANVERFISLLQDFKRRSQLFVITHNKRTMEAADYLYGITMTEPGVTTVASVKIS